jgi:hypothetical protein
MRWVEPCALKLTGALDLRDLWASLFGFNCL